MSSHVIATLAFNASSLPQFYGINTIHANRDGPQIDLTPAGRTSARSGTAFQVERLAYPAATPDTSPFPIPYGICAVEPQR